MGADEEIREHVVTLATVPAVGHERLPCEKERRPGDLADIDTEAPYRLIERLDRRKGQGKLGIDDGIDR